MKAHLFPLLLCLTTLFSFAADGDDLSARIDELSKASWRSEAHIARNQFRHPVETLMFFGLKPDMTVLEISPGRGWYMEILAPLLKEKGAYITTTGDANVKNERVQAALKRFNDKLAETPEAFDKVQTVVEKSTNLGEPNSADMVLTFRNVHNWMGRGQVSDYFKSFYDVLKPGGILGVVEHRGNGSEQDPKGRSGYVNEDYVIKLAENAGFILVARSEVNANAKDTKDHPHGVWTLPPVLHLKGVEDQEARYQAMGESDRMTLKFVKP